MTNDERRHQHHHGAPEAPNEFGPPPKGGCKVKIKDADTHYLSFSGNDLGLVSEQEATTVSVIEEERPVSTLRLFLLQDPLARYVGYNSTGMYPMGRETARIEWSYDSLLHVQLYVLGPTGNKMYWYVAPGGYLSLTDDVSKAAMIEFVFE